VPYGFADPDCHEPAYLCPNGLCRGLLVASSPTDAPGEPLGALHAVKEVPGYLLSGEGCQLVESTPGTLQFFVLGETLSWDMFPALTESGGTSP
jgi:hypothetical protein